MTVVQKKSDLHRLQGEAYITKIIAGENPKDNLRYCGNLKSLTTKMTLSRTPHKETVTGNNRIDDQITSQTQITLSFSFEDISKENFALACQAATNTITAATVTGETHTVGGPDTAFALAKNHLLTFTSLTKGGGGSGSLVLGTDYIAKPASNIIYIPTGSSLIAGDEVTASYTTAATEEILPFAATEEYYYLVFDGINTQNGKKPFFFEAFKMQFNVLQQLELIGDNYVELLIDAECLYDISNDSGDSEYGGYIRIVK